MEMSPPPRRGDDAALAKELVDRLLRGLGTEERAYGSGKIDIYTVDVEVALEQYEVQFRLHRDLGKPFPCLVSDHTKYPCPINLLPGIAPWVGFDYIRAGRTLGPRLLFTIFDYLEADLFGFGEVRIEYFEPERTIEFLRARLRDFLTTRFGARRSDISKSPGIWVRVEAASSGLRVHYSPAYFFDSTNILNAPTTPVFGWMQPGRYLFGASHPGHKPQFDFTAEYDIPSPSGNKVILGF